MSQVAGALKDGDPLHVMINLLCKRLFDMVRRLLVSYQDYHMCYSGRVETGPDFVPGLPHAPCDSRLAERALRQVDEKLLTMDGGATTLARDGGRRPRGRGVRCERVPRMLSTKGGVVL